MQYPLIAKAARDWAVSKVGSKYSQARRTQEGIFDCSSLVARAYCAQGKLWGYGGKVPTSTNEVYDDDFELIWPGAYDQIGKTLGGASVIGKAKQPGDLHFYNTLSTARANKITHVAMVASASRIVHARGTAYGVRQDNLTLYAGKVCALTRYNPDCDLVYGHKGYRTKALQQALNRRGADLNADGEFGPKTRTAVRAFQKAAGLEPDGIAGKATRSALGVGAAHDAAPAEPPAVATGGVRVVGGSVNVRTGPGTGYPSVMIARKGELLAQAAVDGWRPVEIQGEILWISAKPELTEAV
jgi:hypothetical protein